MFPTVLGSAFMMNSYKYLWSFFVVNLLTRRTAFPSNSQSIASVGKYLLTRMAIERGKGISLVAMG